MPYKVAGCVRTRAGRSIACVKVTRTSFKIRVTIAASGQGRWGEELEFPADCRKSGYTPVLIVLDPTPNPKLADLQRAFERQGGDVYIGDRAWAHLEASAGETMGLFIEKYVRTPIERILAEEPPRLPNITFTMEDSLIAVDIGDDRLAIDRTDVATAAAAETDLPDDVDDEIHGPS